MDCLQTAKLLLIPFCSDMSEVTQRKKRARPAHPGLRQPLVQK